MNNNYSILKRWLASSIVVSILACSLVLFLSVINTSARVGGGSSFSGGSRSSGSSSRSSSSSSSSSRSSSSSSSSRSSSSSYGSSSGSSSSYGSSSGSSYSGSGGSYSGSSYESSSVFVYLIRKFPIIFLFAIVFLIIILRSQNNQPKPYSSRGNQPDTEQADKLVDINLDKLRKYDPNFSEPLLLDFIYTLYAQVQDARGRKSLGDFSSYLSPTAIQALNSFNIPTLASIKGVIVGAARIAEVSDPDRSPVVNVIVMFATNFTEEYFDGGRRSENTFYQNEKWVFTRNRNICSRPPEKANVLRCPSCGGSLEKRPDGACAYCGIQIQQGKFDWYVAEIQVLERESKGPLLTSDVAEEGTNLPTVYQYNFAAIRERFGAVNRDFSWEQFQARVCHIFMELQQAWTSLQWERARPYETDNIFQMHFYWISEYQRQQLRNVLTNINIEQVIPVKIRADVFYDAITVRIFANMIDYTADIKGNKVSGNPSQVRRFTEYWTFIRRRGTKANDKENINCPNCGAPLKINMSGICEYCGSKITSGEFDWVLSRIEQDETYL